MENSLENTREALNLLQSKIKCFKCTQLPVDPHLLWCTHSFCKNCITSLRNCPQCNFIVRPQDLAPDIMLGKLLKVIDATSEVSSRSEEKKNKPELKRCEVVLVQNSKGKNVDGSLDSKKATAYCTVINAKKKTNCNSLNKKTKSCSVSPKSHILFSAKRVVRPVNRVNIKGETPLQIACGQGKLEKVQQLLKNGAEPNIKDFAGWTPLCDAVGSGELEVVRALLRAGAGVNTPAQMNTTALLEAVVRQEKCIIKLLLENGADPNQRTTLNNTALSLAEDDIKALITNNRKVLIQPHPRVQTIPKGVSVHKLSDDQVGKVMDLCRKFNLPLFNTLTEETTHVVVSVTEHGSSMTVESSVEVMSAILHGCCVVSMGWVLTSLAQGELQPVDDYEPSGTHDLPSSTAFRRARLNREKLLPRLFDGCHFSLQQDQPWDAMKRQDIVSLITAAGAKALTRATDPERIPPEEQTVMFHAPPPSPLALTSHIVLYQTEPHLPLLRYNMAHAKSLPTTWFFNCIKTFSITL